MATRPLTLAIIGVGARGFSSFGLYLKEHSDVRLQALCDVNPVRLERASADLGGGHALYTDIHELLRTEKNLDAAIITTPDFCHSDHAAAALEAGLSVLVDKPLATTVAGCQKIIETAKQHQRLAVMGFNLRHTPTLIRLKQLIDEGRLGKVFLIENREFYDGGRTYMARWNRLYAKSGGLWVHKGSHDFDMFNWLLGHPKPVRVSAFAQVNVLKPENIPFPLKPGLEPGPSCHCCPYAKICPDVAASTSNHWLDEAIKADGYSRDLCIYLSDKDTHDNGIAMVEYENGARASHMECFIASFTDRRYTVIGDKGIADVSLAERKITIHPRWSADEETYKIAPTRGGHGGADPSLIEDFIQKLQNDQNRTGFATTEHGLWATAIGQAAEISRREQRTVEIDELFRND